MRITYNLDHIGDVLLVSLKKSDQVTYEKKGDITLIKDGQEVIGLNIFNASKNLDFTSDQVDDYEILVPKINNFLKKNDIEPLEFDISPKFIVGKVIENRRILMLINSM